jgi:hypothetical protein
MRLGTGDAPCAKCGQHIDNIPIDLDSAEFDGVNGYYFNVTEPMTCLDCGEPLRYYHKSGDPSTWGTKKENQATNV